MGDYYSLQTFNQSLGNAVTAKILNTNMFQVHPLLVICGLLTNQLFTWNVLK